MDRSQRRSFLLALPQVALTAACAFGAVRGSAAKPSEAIPTISTTGEPQTADEPAPEPVATPRRAQPLPVPPDSERDRTWLQEWLDLAALPARTPIIGC